jgi:hypothetical protein
MMKSEMRSTLAMDKGLFMCGQVKSCTCYM